MGLIFSRMKASPHRAAIAHLTRQGIPPQRIAESLGIPRSTVHRIAKQFKELGHVMEKSKSGRPRSVNVPRLRKVIRERIRRNDGLSINRMASNLGISRTSAQRIVKDNLGMRSYRLLQGQTLTEPAKEQRLVKAKKLLTFFKQTRAHNVLFTDEKVFTIEVARNSQNHRQLLSPVNKNCQKRRIRTRTLFPKSVMVWGGITASGKTPLVFIQKGVKINAIYYQEEILKKVVLPWSQLHFPTGNMMLQQDWAPAHGAKSTIMLCDQLFPGHLTKEMWPSNSPDLNPLDYSVWSVLEERVPACARRNLDAMKAALTKAWDELDDDYLRATVDSLQTRLRACVKAGGGHFEQYLV